MVQANQYFSRFTDCLKLTDIPRNGCDGWPIRRGTMSKCSSQFVDCLNSDLDCDADGMTPCLLFQQTVNKMYDCHGQLTIPIFGCENNSLYHVVLVANCEQNVRLSWPADYTDLWM